jgi:concanavalin A-like lectin/glucanase superfamily protein
MLARLPLRTVTSLLLASVIGGFPLPASASTVAALWHMDESSGSTMVDASGNGNDGTIQHVTFVTPGADGIGGAYRFDGTDSRVVVSDSSDLDPGAEDISISMAIRFSAVPPRSVGDYDLLRKGGAIIYKMEIVSTGRAHCRFSGSAGGKGITFGPSLADGAWHMITCTKTADSIELTVDGTTASRAVTIGSISNAQPLAVGGKARGQGDWYPGDLDEVEVRIGTGSSP